jgi:ribose transport system permease protein
MIQRAIAISEAGIVIILLGLVIFFQTLNQGFLSGLNIAGMLRAMAYPGIVGVGMALCLISGVIDLSVGATVGLTSVIFAEVSTKYGLPLIPSAVIAIGVGLLVGYINGAIVTKLKITPFITTICSMYMIRGLASWISNGYTIYPLPKEFSIIGNAQPLGVSWAFIIMLILMVVGTIAINQTVWGLTVRAVGSDKESAACTEVNVGSVHRSVFVITGGLAGLAGVMVSMMLDSGVPSAGTGWELIIIAGCAIGGISLFGYEGSFFGLFCGLLTMQVIQNGIVVIGVSPYSQTVVIGGILLVAMILEVRRRRWLNLEYL